MIYTLQVPIYIGVIMFIMAVLILGWWFNREKELIKMINYKARTQR